MVRDRLVVSPKHRTKIFSASHPALSGVRSKQANSILGATTVEQALRSTPLRGERHLLHRQCSSLGALVLGQPLRVGRFACPYCVAQYPPGRAGSAHMNDSRTANEGI